MVHFLVQIILAQRRDDGEWMELLIFVVIAVIYALSGILKKARSRKINFGEEEEPEKTRAGKERRRPREKAKKPKFAERRTVAQRLFVERPKEKPFARAKRPAKPLKEPELKPAAAALKVDIKEPEKVIGETIKELEQEPLGIDIAEKKTKSEVAIEKLIDLEDPDELRRAILHYEVLGKPLSLRGFS